MSNSRVAITLEFQAISPTGGEYTVEEYTYFQAKDDPDNIQRPAKKMFSLNDPRPDHNFQPVDHVQGNVYEIRRTGERIIRRT